MSTVRRTIADDEKRFCAPAFPQLMERRMHKRRRFKQTTTLEQRLADQARRLRVLAFQTPPGARREELIRKADEMDDAIRMERWLTSSGLHAPT